MKQVTQNYKTGAIRLEEVAAPALKPGGVLVRTRYSAISIGTEGMKVREAKLSYVGKARARPDQVKKVIEAVRQQGFLATYNKVMNKLDSLTPLGYSLSGEVIAVGDGVDEFHVGQRVACAGAGYANHAEINFVPKNLVVPVPDGVLMEHAAFATTGSIAMQGFRQGEMQLGETACVVGLGLLGQLLVQILRAAGARVIGVDLVEHRCQLALNLGAAAATTPDDPSLMSTIKRLTLGAGVDCVFITAGGSSNAPVELAVQVARDRARVVDIGKTRLDLPWNEYYLKELDVRFSRSYGPGRYDPMYEERGVDYPIGYVRWTERRNLASFLDLVADGKILLDPIISSVRPFAEAEQVYQQIGQGKDDFLGIVFEYPDDAVGLPQRSVSALIQPQPRSAHAQRLGVGVIGAGNYASSMLLPHLARHSDVRLVAVSTTTSLSAQNAVRKFGFQRATTDYTELLADDGIDAVVIATRHSTHARIVAAALRSGKTVFVEKPLALSPTELEHVRRAIIESGNERLMVGFNRRFSRSVNTIKKCFASTLGPMVLNYRVHAGQLDKGSWYLDQAEGTRFAGEAGHFFDVFAYLIGSRPTSVSATCLRPDREASPDDGENVVATVQYENGSIATLAYLTQGGQKLPKEYLEAHGGGRTAQLDNFSSVMVYEGNDYTRMRMGRLDKGQKDEMSAFVEAARTGGPMPISTDCLFDTTLTTVAAVKSVSTGSRVQLYEYWVAASKSSNGEESEPRAVDQPSR
jgi:predicted dehydrogenase/threonine dehydrogenase-like Zn-dependent dehydrogenase